jgi:hypothetical protein
MRGSARVPKVWFAAAAVAAGLAALPPALAQDKRVTHYEPNRRAKVGIETCMKDEVLTGAYCVRKCQPDFRMDLTSKPPLCIATRPNAKFEPVKPGYVTPEKPLARNTDPAGDGFAAKK